MKKRLYQSVAQELLALIEEGKFPRGGRLPGERELAERFGVSRVTIREAEIALEALGHIVIKTGSGAYVQKRPQDSGTNLPDVTAFELTAARVVLEAEVAALAAANVTDAGMAELDGLVAAMDKVNGNGGDDGDHIDRQFHLAIARIAGNPVIEYLVQTLWRIRNEMPKVRKVYASVCVTGLKARSDEHAAILEALRRRDPGAARLAMRDHFHRLFEAMLAVTEHDALTEVKRRIGEDRQRFLTSTKL